MMMLFCFVLVSCDIIATEVKRDLPVPFVHSASCDSRDCAAIVHFCLNNLWERILCGIALTTEFVALTRLVCCLEKTGD